MKAYLKYLEPTILAILSIFAPIKGIIFTVGIVILVDLITGIIAAKKRGEKITSAAIRRTVSKILIYQTAILTGFLIETFLTNDLIPITKIVASIIGVVEGKSVFENLNAISDNKLFSDVLKKLGSINDKEPPKDS